MVDLSNFFLIFDLGVICGLMGKKTLFSPSPLAMGTGLLSGVGCSSICAGFLFFGRSAKVRVQSSAIV